MGRSGRLRDRGRGRSRAPPRGRGSLRGARCGAALAGVRLGRLRASRNGCRRGGCRRRGARRHERPAASRRTARRTPTTPGSCGRLRERSSADGGSGCTPSSPIWHGPATRLPTRCRRGFARHSGAAQHGYERLSTGPRDWLAKRRAARCYRSQLPLLALSRPGVGRLERHLWSEVRSGGERASLCA